jgi:tryptophan synthase beta chain
VLHGSFSYTLQDEEGQIGESHSISAGLDYPGVGPEHAWLKESGRADYTGCTDADALAAFGTLARAEGILPALESAHALAAALEAASASTPPRVILVNLSGRGDKDLATVLAHLGEAPGGRA